MITVRSRKGILRFRKGGPWTDPYGTSWTFSGNPDVLDLQVDPAKKRVGFRAYPDALPAAPGSGGRPAEPLPPRHRPHRIRVPLRHLPGPSGRRKSRLPEAPGNACAPDRGRHDRQARPPPHRRPEGVDPDPPRGKKEARKATGAGRKKLNARPLSGLLSCSPPALFVGLSDGGRRFRPAHKTGQGQEGENIGQHAQHFAWNDLRPSVNLTDQR